MNEEFLDMLKKINSNLRDISSGLSQMNDTLSEIKNHSNGIENELNNIEITLTKNLKEIDKSIFQQLEDLTEVIANK